MMTVLLWATDIIKETGYHWQLHLHFFSIYLRCPDSLLDARKPEEDTTQLAITLRMTQIAGIIISFIFVPTQVPTSPFLSLLSFAGVVPLTYGILLHNQVSCKYQSQASIPVEASKFTLAVAEVSISLLNHVALVDLQMLQVSNRSFLHFLLPSKDSFDDVFHDANVHLLPLSRFNVTTGNARIGRTVTADEAHYAIHFVLLQPLAWKSKFTPSGHTFIGLLLPHESW